VLVDSMYHNTESRNSMMTKDRGRATTHQVLLLRCLQCSCKAAACCQSYVCCIMATATQYGCKALLLSWVCKTRTAQQHTCDPCEQHHVILLSGTPDVYKSYCISTCFSNDSQQVKQGSTEQVVLTPSH